MKDFWTKWRHEIVRGGLLFTGVVAVGLLLFSGFHRVRQRVADSIAGGLPALRNLRNITAGFGADFDGPGRTHGDLWSWHKKLAPGQVLTIRNVSGPVDVESASGLEANVTTEKSWLGDDSGTVQLVAVESATGVTICAVQVGSQSDECGAHHWSSNEHHGQGVAVKFTVRVPKGVNVDVGTMTGDVQVVGGTGAMTVKSGTGDVSVTTMAWPVDLESGTGDVTATLGAPAQGGANVKSGTGDVSVTLPTRVNLNVDAHTGTGDLSDDFALPVTEAQYGPSKSLVGKLGSGGATLTLVSGTGDVSINKSDRITIVASPTFAPAVAKSAAHAPHAPKATPVTAVHPK